MIKKSYTLCIPIEVEQVLAVEEFLPKKYRRKWRIGSKTVCPNNKVDDSKPVFSAYIDPKLPQKMLSKLRRWLKIVNHAMWGGMDYDTLDSLTRVLNPEEVLSLHIQNNATFNYIHIHLSFTE